MRRLFSIAVLAAALAGCNTKPSEEACEKAIENIRTLTGQTGELGPRQRAAMRSCQAQSQRETVECYASARSKEELFSCGGELADAVRKAEEKSRADGAGAAAGTGTGTGTGTPAPAPAPAPAGSESGTKQ